MSQSDERTLQGAIARLVRRCLDSEIADVTELSPGLGTRRFFRLRLKKRDVETAIARVECAATSSGESQPAIAAEPPLEPLRSFLESAGLPVPARYGADPEHGIELLEDVGSQSLEALSHLLPAPERRTLYAAACELLPSLQSLTGDPSQIPAFGRRLDERLVLTKAEKFLSWTLPWIQAGPASAGQREVVLRSFRWIGRLCEQAPARLSHRDYKAANLHLARQHASAEPRLVLIDLQGAFMAPPEYDLVCLLRDSHVELGEEEVASHLQRTRPLLPDRPDPETFLVRFDALTLSRVAKDVSHYIHAATDRGDLRYLPFVPLAFRNLARAAQHSADGHPPTDDLADLIQTLIGSLPRALARTAERADAQTNTAAATERVQ